MRRIVYYGFYNLHIAILSATKHKAKAFTQLAILDSDNLYVKSKSLHDRNTFGGKMCFWFDKSVFIEYFHYATC